MKDSTQCEDPFSSCVNILAQKFDAAYETHDKEQILGIIEEAKLSMPGLDYVSQANLHYSLGTAYGDLETLDQSFHNEGNLEKQIYHLRKSVELIEKDSEVEKKYLPHINGLKRVLYTNYAKNNNKNFVLYLFFLLLIL